MISLPGRCGGHPAGSVGAGHSRPTPLATLGGRSAQRHYGVDGVPTPERTVDPVAMSLGAPGESPQLENRAMDCAFGAGYDGAFLEGIGEYGIREASGTCQFHEDRSMPEESNFHGNHPRPFGPAKKASQLRSRGNNADLAASGSIGPPVCRWANPLPRP